MKKNEKLPGMVIKRGAPLEISPESVAYPEIELSLIAHNPFQVRQHFDMEKFDALSSDIERQGVLEPILLRKLPEPDAEGRKYVIIAGEQRYRAAGQAGLQKIPGRVMDVDEDEAIMMTLAENIHRTDPDIEDEARFYEWLAQKWGTSGKPLSIRALGERIDIDPMRISRARRIVGNPDILAKYRAGLVTINEAMKLISAPPEQEEEGDQGQGEKEKGAEVPEESPYLANRAELAGRTTFQWPPFTNVVRFLERTMIRYPTLPPSQRLIVKSELDTVQRGFEELRRLILEEEPGQA